MSSFSVCSDADEAQESEAEECAAGSDRLCAPPLVSLLSLVLLLAGAAAATSELLATTESAETGSAAAVLLGATGGEGGGAASARSESLAGSGQQEGGRGRGQVARGEDPLRAAPLPGERCAGAARGSEEVLRVCRVSEVAGVWRRRHSESTRSRAVRQEYVSSAAGAGAGWDGE